MRSRDGNYAQLFSALLLVSSATTLLAATDAYIISYRATVKNAQLLHEKLSLSRAMTPCRGSVENVELILPIAQSQNLRTIIEQNRDTFFTYMQTQDLHVKSAASKGNNSYSELTTLTLPPHCFIVTINENFAIISAFK